MAAVRRVLVLIFLLLIACARPAFAAEEVSGYASDDDTADADTEDQAALDEDMEDLSDTLLAELDLDEIDGILSESGAAKGLTFEDLVNRILDPEQTLSTEDVFDGIASLLFSEAAECKSILVQILLLTIAFAFFRSFTDVFENSQIAGSGFYMCFLVLAALLMRSYLAAASLFSNVMEQMVEVMQAVIPAFAMTLVFASAATTAAAFYQIAIAVIWLVERLLSYAIAPAIHVYAFLAMMNCLTGEQMISRLTALLKKIILWSLKALLAGVAGMNVIENMIAPSVDNLKKMSVTKTLGMIPGLGGVTEAVSNLFLGSAVVIKNGVGVAAMIALLLVVFGPLMKILVFALMYRVAGAIVQPFADSRVCGCIDGVGESMGMLIRTMMTGILLFLITIAIVITAVR
ncbi:MAG: stage III sporulation protein AE [Clostridiales bacterium]|nr:stage III sporulation protein AE [Clostridiales bacterium]